MSHYSAETKKQLSTTGGSLAEGNLWGGSYIGIITVLGGVADALFIVCFAEMISMKSSHAIVSGVFFPFLYTYIKKEIKFSPQIIVLSMR